MNPIERMFDLLQAKALSVQSLCDNIGVSSSVVANWKARNEYPPSKYIQSICEFLEVSSDYLLTGKDISPKLTENELELLHIFSSFSEREQIKIIGQLENELKHNKKSLETVPEIQQYDIQMAAFGGGTTSQHVNMAPEEYKEWIEDLKKDAE